MKNKSEDLPFRIKVSFQKVIEAYKERYKTEDKKLAKKYLEDLLEYIQEFPELSDGIENIEEIEKYDEPIQILLDDIFPNVLTNNEIKAATVPKYDIVLSQTNRFKEIINNAGEGFEFRIRNFEDEFDYIRGCLLILKNFYKYDIDFSRPLYYDIPEKGGITKNYRLAVNADFVSFEKTETALEVTEEDVDVLIQNTDNIELWKEKFPPHSWIFKGFILLNLTDVTVDDGISDLKTELLNNNVPEDKNMDGMLEIFRSIYRIPDLEIGFTMFEDTLQEFYNMKKGLIKSYILDNKSTFDCKNILCESAYDTLINKQSYFVIANVENYAEKNSDVLLAQNLLANNVKSCILAPISKNNNLLGVLELVSFRKNELNNINAIKLEDVLPYIVTAVERNKTDFENRVKAVIQSECTSIHPSVLWVFEEEAKRFIEDLDSDGVSSFRDIAFKDIYPLYGQIDIVGSSEERNNAIQKDLLSQLNSILIIINEAYDIEPIPIYEQMKFRIEEFSKDLKENLNASSEQKIINFIYKELNPLIEHLEHKSESLKSKVEEYEKNLDPKTGVIYDQRKNYDDTVQRINRTLSRYLDRKQADAQKIYPHYFERYKTDGVDHNMYIGSDMVKNKPFSEVYLFNLRLWQLQVMCEMENRFYNVQENMPLKLDAASLILVFSSTLSIRYRMDEKKFDVDGTYNARYEIIKKRIDKAYIKDTEERVTQKGKIAIVYSQKSDEREYLRYIKYLQKKNYLGDQLELLELEDVQGVVGLRAIRINVLYKSDDKQENISYENLMKELHH